MQFEETFSNFLMRHQEKYIFFFIGMIERFTKCSHKALQVFGNFQVFLCGFAEKLIGSFVDMVQTGNSGNGSIFNVFKIPKNVLSLLTYCRFKKLYFN